MFTGTSSNSKAFQDLLVLIVSTIMVYISAALLGWFEALEKWERQHGLTRVHAEELIVVLVTLGVATTIFFIRRYRELRWEITERKEAERVLRESRNKALLQKKDLEALFQHIELVKKEWESMLDSVGDMVVLSDNAGNVSRCNRAFSDFVGRPYEDIIGKPLQTLLKEQGIEVSNLDVQALNAYFKTRGKWYGLKSYPFNDIVTGDRIGAVVLMHDESDPGVVVELVDDAAGHDGMTEKNRTGARVLTQTP